MLRIYNSLSRKVEDFKPLHPGSVGLYTCGPTVYDYQHIGHMRRYVGDDILIRVLTKNKYSVKQVMNITDVGHLTSDSDTGEDKMEKGAKKYGLSVWDIAKKFEKQFFDSAKALNIPPPTVLMHATDYIADQIDLIRILEEKGYTYQVADGIYFDTSKFPHYSRLSGQKLEKLKAGARVDITPGKRNPTDFALWKFSYPYGRSFDVVHPERSRRTQDDAALQRQMEWDSPWGVGFPGWHIECSAMAMNELGSTLDIHTGGIDHISIHHTNEIAQSEAASGKPFVRYWIHHAFLIVEGQKMSKSLGNFFTVEDVIHKGFNPLALRYLFLQTHYRQEMNFTWEALGAAQTAYDRLREIVHELRTKSANLDHPTISKEGKESRQKFMQAVNDDLNMPQALAILWELVRRGLSPSETHNLLLDFDQVFGLKLHEAELTNQQPQKIPQEVHNLVQKRQSLRQGKKWQEADLVRKKIEDLGYTLEDKREGIAIKKLN